MSDADTFLAGILANPADYAPRGVFADWLEEHGDERFAIMRTGTVGEAVAAFCPAVVTEGAQLKHFMAGLQDVGPWRWLGYVKAQAVWHPAVVIRRPLIPTDLHVAVTDASAAVRIRTPDAALECWTVTSDDSFAAPIPPLPGEWTWLLVRGGGRIFVRLTVEDGRGDRRNGVLYRDDI